MGPFVSRHEMKHDNIMFVSAAEGQLTARTNILEQSNCSAPPAARPRLQPDAQEVVHVRHVMQPNV